MDEQTLVASNENTAEAAGNMSQDDVDRIVKDRLSRAKAQHINEVSELQAKLSGFEQAEADRAKAALTEVEKIALERDEILTKATNLEQQLVQVQADHMRSNLITELAPQLPKAYRGLITGNDADTITASLTEAVAEYTKDFGPKAQPQPIGTPGNSASPDAQITTGSSPLDQYLAGVTK